MILVINSFSCYMFLVTLMSPLHQNTFLSWPSVEWKSDPSVSKVVQQLGFVDPNLYNLSSLLKLFSRGYLSKSMVMFFLLEAFFLRSFKTLLKLHGLNPYEDHLSNNLKPSPLISSATLTCFMFVISELFLNTHPWVDHEILCVG